jgi:hypothetical protein
MKLPNYVALLSILAVLSPLSAFARDKNQHSVNIPDAVQVGSTQLQPGNYKVEWQGTGPAVQVAFVRNGKTVATVPGTLKTNDDEVIQDAVLTDSVNKTLDEIDFRHEKEALVFQSGM